MKRLIVFLVFSCLGLTHAMVNPSSVRTPQHPAASQPAESDDMAAPPVPIHHTTSAPRVSKKRGDKRTDPRGKNTQGKPETPAHKRPHRYSLLITN